MPNIPTSSPDAGFPVALPVPFGVAQYLPSSLWPLLYLPFDFSVTQALGANGTATANQTPSFQVQNDSHFALCQYTGAVRTTASPPANQPTPPILVQVTDTGSGFILQDNPQDFVAIIGTAQLPALTIVPYLAVANSIINVNLQNLDATQGFTARLSFRGFKIYAVARNNPQIQAPTR